MPGVLRALKARTPAQRRVALVVAHPDDETIAAGGSLHLFPGLLLVHVTDGAPRRLDDARRAGFDGPAAYAAAREAELQAALGVAGVRPARARLGVPDQDAVRHLGAAARALETLFARHGTETVLTHAYEGGHPDHDATAFAAHLAAGRLGLPVVEFPAYRAGQDGQTLAQAFLPGPPEVRVALAPAEVAVKRGMLDCFRSQAGVLAMFDVGVERFRPAPAHDFGAPPHPGRLNYEAWGWEMTGAAWRGLARAEAECAA